MNQLKKQSGFALPLAILIVVVLIGAGGAGYYFYKTSIDETANWETYKNRGYGFEFKYPKDFYIKITNMVRIEKISDFPEEPDLGPSLDAVLEERDSVNSSGIDTGCSLLVLSGQHLWFLLQGQSNTSSRRIPYLKFYHRCQLFFRKGDYLWFLLQL